MREGVTTLPGSLGVNPPEWTTAHHNVPPEWLDQVDHPCMIGGRHGTMQIVDGRLICVVPPKESQMNIALSTLIDAAKNPLADLPIHQQLTHAVTRYDRRQEDAAKRNPKRHYNQYALGHYLGAAERAHEDIKKGHSVADAVNNHFNGPLANHIHRMLNTGGKAREGMDTEMDDVITEATTLRFSSPSRIQIAKAQVYWDIHRRQKGLGKVKVGPIEGTDGNWFFDVSSNSDNQFLVPTRMNNILPADVTVTAGGPIVVQQVASQDETKVRNLIREMVEEKIDELHEKEGGAGAAEKASGLKGFTDLLGSHRYTNAGTGGNAESIYTRKGGFGSTHIVKLRHPDGQNVTKWVYHGPQSPGSKYYTAGSGLNELHSHLAGQHRDREGRSEPLAKWTPGTARRRVGGSMGT